MGSYNALHSLYLGEVQVATAHLWDSASGTYYIPYVRAMLPGMDALSGVLLIGGKHGILLNTFF